MPDKTHFMGAA